MMKIQLQELGQVSRKS